MFSKYTIILVVILFLGIAAVAVFGKMFYAVINDHDKNECSEQIVKNIYYDRCNKDLSIKIEEGLYEIISGKILEKPEVYDKHFLKFKADSLNFEIDIDTLKNVK